MSNAYINDFNTTVQTYYKELKKCNPISREKEVELIKRAKKNDLKAKNTILTSNLKFVFDVVIRFLRIDDLFFGINLVMLLKEELFA